MRIHLLIAAALLAAPASAQTNPPRRVEAGVTDTDPLRRSLRVLPGDLRRPTGFEYLYWYSTPRALGDPAHSRTGTYARISGGLVATFPRSVYINTPQGAMPEIPPGTVFHIGGIPAPAYTIAAPRPEPSGALDRRRDTSATNQAPPPTPLDRSSSAAATDAAASPWGSDSARAQRITTIITRARIDRAP